MTIGGFSAQNTMMKSNAAYGMMQNMDGIMNLANSTDGMGDLQAIMKKEQAMQLDMLKDELEYKAMEAREESDDKLKDKWAESFDIFS